MPKKKPPDSPPFKFNFNCDDKPNTFTMSPDEIESQQFMLSGAQYKVLGFVRYMNFRIKNPTNQLSCPFISKGTNLDEKTVRKALLDLEKMDAIEHYGKGPRGIKLYRMKWTPPKSKSRDLGNHSPSESRDLGNHSPSESRDLGNHSPRTSGTIPHNYKTKHKEETTTNPKDKSQSSLSKSKTKIPQELIDELPEPFRVDKGVLKLLSEALNGELVATINKEKKRIEAKDAPTLIKNIRYLRGIIESGKPIGNYNGYLCTVIANEWEAKPVAVKTQAQKAEEERLARKAETDAITRELDENERLVKEKNEADEKLLIEIKALPSEELDALKTKALEVMPQFDKTRYSTATESLKQSIIERNMLRAYKKSHRQAAV